MNKLITLGSAALVLMLSWGHVRAGETAGRVLVVAGDVFALRGGQEIRLARGATVESGDTLKVGDASNLQVRFTDEAVVSLRQNSEFRIDNYKFVQETQTGASVFNLVKGGLRTITGLIGRNSRENYSLNTVVATIGIRGTHFNLVFCNSDCRQPDGSLAPNGLYGGVTDGRVVSRNQAGEFEFGKDQFFRVASSAAAAETLLTPPSFLRDRLEGQARNRGSGTTVAAGTTQTAGRTIATTSVEAAISPASGESTVSSSVSGTGFQSQAITDSVAGNNYAIVTSHTNGLGSGGPDSFDTTGTNSFAGAGAARVAAGGQQGSYYAGGDITWGWNASGCGVGASGCHWAKGIDNFTYPTSGIATYTNVGGTAPTDQSGNVGTVTSGGTLSVNYGTNAASMVTPLAYTVGGRSYSITFSNAAFKDVSNASLNTSSTSYCTNCGGQSVGLDVQLRLTGTNAAGAIMAIGTNTTGGTVTQTTATVQAYKK